MILLAQLSQTLCLFIRGEIRGRAHRLLDQFQIFKVTDTSHTMNAAVQDCTDSAGLKPAGADP